MICAENGITLKHVYFNISVLFIVATTSILRSVYSTAYCFGIDGHLGVCFVVVIVAIVVFLFFCFCFFCFCFCFFSVVLTVILIFVIVVVIATVAFVVGFIVIFFVWGVGAVVNIMLVF